MDLEQNFNLPVGGSISATANYRFQGSRETSLLFTDGAKAEANKFLDANIQYRTDSGKWDLTAYVNSLVRNRSIVRAQAGAGGDHLFRRFRRARTWGVRTNFRF